MDNQVILPANQTRVTKSFTQVDGLKANQVLGWARTLANSLESFVTGKGGQFDKGQGLAWGLPDHVTWQEYWNMYRSNFIVQKVVDIPADEMTRAGREFNPNEEFAAEEIEDIEELERRLDLTRVLRDTIRWTRLFGGGALLLVVGDNPNMEKPLNPKTIKKGALKGVMPLSPRELQPGGEWRKDSFLKTGFLEPEFYTISLPSMESFSYVHHTRVILMRGLTAPPLQQHNQYAGFQWGSSILDPMRQSIINATLVMDEVATMVQEAKVDVFNIEGLAGQLSNSKTESNLMRRFALSSFQKSNHQALLLDANEQYSSKAMSFAGLGDLLRQYVELSSGIADIPATRMLGQAPRGLNASGDSETRNFYDAISEKQTQDLRPALEKLDAVLIPAALGEWRDNNDLDWKFKDLYYETEESRARVEQTWAAVAQQYMAMGILSKQQIAEGVRRRENWDMTPKDVKKQSDKTKEMAEGMGLAKPAGTAKPAGKPAPAGKSPKPPNKVPK